MTYRIDDNTKHQLSPHIFNMIRGLAIDNARKAVEIATVADLTDNSTGIAAAAFVSMPVPSAEFDATSAGGADVTTFNAAIVKINNASRVLVNSFNNARARVGLPVMTAGQGTQAAADTVPALDKTVTTANGTSAVDYEYGREVLSGVRRNVNRLIAGVNDVLRALGEPQLVNGDNGEVGGNITSEFLESLGTATGSADGSSALSKAAADAFLLAVANNIATMANAWNNKMFQTGLTDLTDSTGGTAHVGTLDAATLPAAADGAATTSSPKAGFDTQLGLIANAQASLASRINVLAKRYSLTSLTDNTGGSVSTTLAAQSATLTAVDGSSGTAAVEQASARARMQTVLNGNASIVAKLNELAPYFGVQYHVDSSGGVASNTLAVIAATATGVSGAGATLLDADVDAWLSVNRNNIATLAAMVNAMTGTGVPTKPLSVVNCTATAHPSY